MIVGRRVTSIVSASCASLALVACSTVDDADSCAEMIRVLSDGADAIAEAAQDPATAGEQLREFADDLRSAAEGASDEVASAAGDLATLYDDMADDIEAGGVPDMSAVTSNVTALEDACT